MNTANHSAESAAKPVSPASVFYWSVRRELWEYRAIYLAPAIAGLLVVIGFLARVARIPETLRADITANSSRITEPYIFAAFLMMFVSLLVGVFYSIDALHTERRDRSILFWKSMPVSDVTSVFAKASVPIVVVHVVTFLVLFATYAVMLLVSSAVVAASGGSVGALWHLVSPFELTAMSLNHLVVMHALWYAPLFGWLLMVSAWARRMPFLWATLPWLVAGVLEGLIFQTSYVAGMLEYRFTGMRMPASDEAGHKAMGLGVFYQMTPEHMFANPALWIGLGFTVAFLLIAARGRRYREIV